MAETLLSGIVATLAASDNLREQEEALTEGLRSALKLEAVLAEGLDRDGALEADPDHEGYLVRELQGTQIYVPFNLARVFPGADILASVIDIGKSAKLGEEGVLCISGSTTFLGQLNVIADLDFSEYYQDSPSELAGQLERASSGNPLALVEVKLGDMRCHAPWDCLTILAANYEETPARLKLDYVSCGKLGAMPTTNVVIPAHVASTLLAESFAHQEAVLGPPEPVRVLIDATEYGRYVRFLIQEVENYIQKSETKPRLAIKAMKRLLSLLSAAGYEELVERALVPLQYPEIEELVGEMRLEDLQEKRSLMGPGAPQMILTGIASLEQSAGQTTPEQRKEALVAIRDWASTLLAELQSDLRRHAES